MRARRFLAVVGVGLLVLSGCGGGDDGDLETFCQLVRDGHGLPGAGDEIDPSEFDTLVDLAPQEIRPAVEQLANTARDLSEITELDQLFAAAFDPEAQAARDAFDDYAIETCGVDESIVASGAAAPDVDVLEEISQYIETNFRDQAWATKVRYEVDQEGVEIEGLSVTFVVRAADAEALDVCRALSVWLYSVKSADGPIEILDDDLVIVSRESVDGSCRATDS